MRVRTLLGIAAATAVALSAALTTTPAQAATGIDVLNVNGSGCRHDTVSVVLSPDREAFTVTYSAYFVEVLGGARKAVSKNCRINLRINPVPGYSPAISAVDYRGFAEIPDGATGAQSAGYRFHGVGRTVTETRSLAGPYSDYWQVTGNGGAPVFGACGKSRILDLDSSLTVTPGTSATGEQSFLAMDSTDGVTPTTYHLTWQRCA